MGTIHYLEMSERSQFKPKDIKDRELKIEKVEIKQFKLNKFLYNIVGEPFSWFDKAPWSDDQWREYVEDSRLNTWVAWKKGAIVGYFELLNDSDSVEIKYFGLTTDFIGKGLGGGFLSYAIDRAWEMNPGRVILNTCDDDHPYALKNYLDRGFIKIREEVK